MHRLMPDQRERDSEDHRQVEVYGHGGWWKDNAGHTGQVPMNLASRSPMATIAAVANVYGVDGWLLADVVSAHHNSYLLSFERVPARAGRP
jgi:hypothetical protein